MTANWQIILDHQEQRRKVATMDGRARAAGAPEDADDVEFSLTLFADQVSLNVPASTLGRAIHRRPHRHPGAAETGTHRQVQLLLGPGSHGGHAHRPVGPARPDRLPTAPGTCAPSWSSAPPEKIIVAHAKPPS